MTSAGEIFVFDTMCLSQFALAERLDVLRDLVLDQDCWTTGVVLAELREGVDKYPELLGSLDLDWLSVARLDQLDEIRCFMKWASLIGSGERDLGEASVIAAAELRGGVAITDDREAVLVGRHHGARVHGTIWLLAGACRDGKLTVSAAGMVVESLRESALHLPCTGLEFAGYARSHGLL